MPDKTAGMEVGDWVRLPRRRRWWQKLLGLHPMTPIMFKITALTDSTVTVAGDVIPNEVTLPRKSV